MDCVHCYLDVKNPERGELSTAEVVGILDQLRAAGTLFLTFTGGEVFLRKDLFEILEAARARTFAFRLFTSGTLLGKADVERLAALKPVAVEISIYALRSEVHDRITRRKGSLRKSLKAAAMLRRAGVPVAIKTPLLADADGGHFELIDAARRLGAGCRLDPSLISRRDGGTEPLAQRVDIDRLAELFADERLYDPVQQLPPPHPATDAPCAIARRVVHIGPTGDVFPCSAFPIAAGSLRESSFDEIWNGSHVLGELRSITVGDLEGECGDCSRAGYCGRCGSQALLEHGNFRGPTAEACTRAEAREKAAGLPAPAGARSIAHGARGPLGRRPIVGSDFVSVSSLRRRA